MNKTAFWFTFVGIWIAGLTINYLLYAGWHHNFAAYIIAAAIFGGFIGYFGSRTYDFYVRPRYRAGKW